MNVQVQAYLKILELIIEDSKNQNTSKVRSERIYKYIKLLEGGLIPLKME